MIEQYRYSVGDKLSVHGVPAVISRCNSGFAYLKFCGNGVVRSPADGWYSITKLVKDTRVHVLCKAVKQMPY